VENLHGETNNRVNNIYLIKL